MRKGMILLLLVQTLLTFGQRNYGTPPADLIPEKLQSYKRTIKVTHFPKENDPVEIDGTYYWKHMTAILCKESDITIIEYGAYLFYNDQWNLRRSYPIKELDKTFGTKKQLMNQGEPYAWMKNWRTGSSLFGGWALWYFIGRTSDGTTVCGYETINTTTTLLN